MTPTPKSADTSHVRPLMDIAMSLSEHLHLVQDRIDAAIEAQLAAPLQLDQNESDPGVLWAEIWRLRTAVAGPNGYATWQEAATAERVRRVEAERKLAAAAPQGVQAEPPSGDTPLLDFLREESLDLRCIDVPTGGDDYDIRWLVIGHYQEKPRERLIGESFTDEPRDAIKDAMANTDARGRYDRPARPGAPSPAPAVQPTEAVARPSYDDLVWCLERIKEASTSYDTAFDLSSKILDQVAARRRYEAQQQAASQPEAVADLVEALSELLATHGQPQGGSNG